MGVMDAGIGRVRCRGGPVVRIVCFCALGAQVHVLKRSVDPMFRATGPVTM